MDDSGDVEYQLDIVVNDTKSLAAKEAIRKHSIDFGGSLSDADCIKLTGISRNSFYKYKRELKEETQE